MTANYDLGRKILVRDSLTPDVQLTALELSPDYIQYKLK